MPVPSSSRPPAPVVAPIEHAGIRYEQDKHDDRAGDQAGGYLAAIDSKTGSRLGRLKVYEVQDQRVAGLPTFARYFRSMILTPDGAALDIEDETGAVYRVDLARRTSTFISGPPDISPPERLVPPKPQP